MARYLPQFMAFSACFEGFPFSQLGQWAPRSYNGLRRSIYKPLRLGNTRYVLLTQVFEWLRDISVVYLAVCSISELQQWNHDPFEYDMVVSARFQAD